jgi:hypothetical protein
MALVNAGAMATPGALVIAEIVFLPAKVPAAPLAGAVNRHSKR